MERYIIVDNRIRNEELEYINKFGNVIKLPTSNIVYPEISSHVDIFCTKIFNDVVIENETYRYIVNNVDKLDLKNVICGKSSVFSKYPLDVKYNVCTIGNFAIHNFEHTDEKVLEIIDKYNMKKINVKQGYSKCSIAKIDEKSCIVTDKKIAQVLRNNDIDVLCIDVPLDIKLLDNRNNYSKMNGFVGGAICNFCNDVIVFGDLSRIDKDNVIRNFIYSKNKNIIDFKGLDVIDYGGIIEFGGIYE